MNFLSLQQALAVQFKRMCDSGQLFRVKVDKDKLWETYLAAFPEGTNPIFRKRTEHDCSCCRSFIKNVGDVVAIIDGKMVSIWDVELPCIRGYKDVASAMSALIHSHQIEDVFLHFEAHAGQLKTFEQMVDKVHTWNHFHVSIPQKYVRANKDIPSALAEPRMTQQVFLRGLKELSFDAIDTVLDLIAQNSLYRGEEFRPNIEKFRTHMQNFNSAPDQHSYTWEQAVKAPLGVTRLRNTAIGTLLVDLSEGRELEHAVKAFETMVAPTNYRRPSALVTPRMVEDAKAKLAELNLLPAIERRYATLADISVDNLLFANRNTSELSKDVFGTLAEASATTNPKAFDRVEEVSIEKFIDDILPRVKSLELLVEGRHASNFVSLTTAVDPTAELMFKWDNPFAWSYAGEVTDAIKERVKAAGGNVTGEFCCRLAWDYSDDLDLHMLEPTNTRIYYSNRRSRSINGGMLDVDANGADGVRENPVENIFYERLTTMREGTYTLLVNNYNRRSGSNGFQVDVEILGKVHSFKYDKVVRSGENVEIAVFNYSKKEGLQIIRSLPLSEATRPAWGVDPKNFKKVSAMMLSPNYWKNTAGNKHYFFMLEGCKNESTARGFYNEFLKPELDPHRKVLELVGSKTKVADSPDQLSGVGFSSTQRADIICRIQGSTLRTVRIIF